MTETLRLSEDALVLLRLRLSGERCDVTDANRDAYRELAAAGIMYPLHTFAKGRDSLYRFTDEGWARREEWPRLPAPHHCPKYLPCRVADRQLRPRGSGQGLRVRADSPSAFSCARSPACGRKDGKRPTTCQLPHRSLRSATRGS